VTLPGLLETHDIRWIDLLHIDTEGHDWKILRQLNLDKISPFVIMFENKHFNQEERDEVMFKLGQKYKIIDLGADYLCVKK
jgi:hypothetical protein